MACNFIIMREFKINDTPAIAELVRDAYLSDVGSSWWNAITKEITFQLIVVSAAIMFIFMGIPLHYCVFSIPFVLIVIYICIYVSVFVKAMELMSSKKHLASWVAETYEPYFSTLAPEKCIFKIMDQKNLLQENIDINGYKRKIVGTIAVSRHLNSKDAVWIFRLAVDARYRRKGIASSLVRKVRSWSRMNNYDSMQLAISECQEYARQLFINSQFEVKQLYHKPLVANAITLQMYHLEAKIDKSII